MINKERLLKLLHIPYNSEKTSLTTEETNTLVFKVAKNATKAEIKTAAKQLLKVEVREVNTMIVKGKVKRHRQRTGYRSNWKKAYITLKEGQRLDLTTAMLN